MIWIFGGISSEIKKKWGLLYKIYLKKENNNGLLLKNVMRKVCKFVLKEKKFLNVYKFF